MTDKLNGIKYGVHSTDNDYPVRNSRDIDVSVRSKGEGIETEEEKGKAGPVRGGYEGEESNVRRWSYSET